MKMRSALSMATTLALCACATVPKTAAEQDSRYLAASQLLGCSPNDIHLSTTTRAPQLIAGEGCGHTVQFSEMCRNPGPYETAYVQSVPPPPAVAELERGYDASRSTYGNFRRQDLDAYFLQTGKMQEMQYGQGLADARMRDVGVPVQPTLVAKDSLKMPEFWLNANCQVVTYDAPRAQASARH